MELEAVREIMDQLSAVTPQEDEESPPLKNYRQGALTTRNNYTENWYAKTFPYEEGALK